jgi:hypothetical protein
VNTARESLNESVGPPRCQHRPQADAVRPVFIEGFLAGTRLNLTPFCNLRN